jgi:hypothetical protein
MSLVYRHRWMSKDRKVHSQTYWSRIMKLPENLNRIEWQDDSETCEDIELQIRHMRIYQDLRDEQSGVIREESNDFAEFLERAKELLDEG